MRKMLLVALAVTLLPAGALRALGENDAGNSSATPASAAAPRGPAVCPGPESQAECLTAQQLAEILADGCVPDAGLLSIAIERVHDDAGRVRAIRITIEVWDVRTEQVRQITIVQDL